MEFKYILDQNQKLGLNAIIVQVRTSADAFYKSSYEPWSTYLSGKQGKDPGYDPLEFMIEECHKRNMEFHAWFNLFRGVSHTRFIEVTDDHITKTRPEWFFEYKDGLYFDPGIPQVRAYLQSVILEVVENYDIDGVHLDDYFYPNIEDKDNKIRDKKSFKKYKGDIKKLQNWRRNNINLLIQGLNQKIKARKSYVKFGVSPFPVWRHKFTDKRGSNTDRTSACYDHYYADTRRWMEEGWVDYLMPQFYWGQSFRRAPFREVTGWWNDNTFGRHLYGGLAYYKLNNSQINPHSDPSWKYQDEIYEQIDVLRKYPNITGVSFYSQGSFNKTRQVYTDGLRNNYFMKPALMPTMSWLDNTPPKAPTNVTSKTEGDNIVLNWDPPIGDAQDLAYSYVIYGHAQGQTLNFSNAENLIAISKTPSISLSLQEYKGYVFYIRSLDRLHNESLNMVGIVVE